MLNPFPGMKHLDVAGGTGMHPLLSSLNSKLLKNLKHYNEWGD